MQDDERREYEDTIARLMRERRTDALTGLGNYTGMVEYCDHLVKLFVPFSVVLLDMTNLKRANELLGHFGADVLLSNVGAAIRGDGWDAVFRHGGDEFAVILPGAPLGGALSVRDRIEAAVGLNELPDGTPVRAIGAVAHVPPGGDLHAELNRADKALEQRKREWKLANRHTILR